MIGTFKLPMTGGGVAPPVTPTPWTPPADWIDISAVGDNEINLLVTEGTGIAFTVTTASGTYSVDWGDGVIESGLVSGAIQQHQHTINGTACSQGYHTWKVRVYGATGNITTWKVARHTWTARIQYARILSANFGTRFITDYSYAFYGSSGTVQCSLLKSCAIVSFINCTNTMYMFYFCYALTSIILPTSWGSVTVTFSMFYNCYALNSIILPASWGNVANLSNMFYCCYALTSITLPTTWDNATNLSNMFYYCYALNSIILPASWGKVTTTYSLFSFCYALTSITLPTTWGLVNNTNQMFMYCYALTSIILPTSWGNITTTYSMFYFCYALTSITLPTSWGLVNSIRQIFMSCYSLKTIINIEYLGSLTVQSDFTDFMIDCEFVQQNISIGSLISKIGCYGASGFKLKISSFRLTNTGSTFTGASPQVNVSYTSLGQADLVALFGDLPTLTGKTINITGSTGAASLTAGDRAVATGKGWTITG